MKRLKSNLALSAVLALGMIFVAAGARADTYEGSFGTGSGVATGLEGIVISAPTASPAAGTYTGSRTVTLTATDASYLRYTIDGSVPSCSTGTQISSGGTVSVTSSLSLKAISCYPSSYHSSVATHSYAINAASTGGGGGGGGSTTPTCTAVSYSDWLPTCYGGKQFRTILTQSPSSCRTTSAQQTSLERACQVDATDSSADENSSTTGTTDPIESTGSTPATDVLTRIQTEAGILDTRQVDNVLSHLSSGRNQTDENSGLSKYTAPLTKDLNLGAEFVNSINNFIVYGTQSTLRLGAGERAGVISSYRSAYGKVPTTEVEWSDALKIASGRWPSERNAAAEEAAKEEFRYVYLREPDFSNNNDENAVMVIAYGLRPSQRNLASEAAAIKIFTAIYGHAPVRALAWDIVRAIAYSGATR